MITLTPAQIEAYEANGYLVLASGLSRAEIDALRTETLALLADVEERKAGDAKYQAMTKYRRFAMGLHLRSEAIRAYVLSDVFRAIGRAFIGEAVDLHGTTTITKSAGKNHSIDWHQDAVYEADGHFPRLICWTALTEANPENGGIFAIPGSHRNGLLPHEKSPRFERDLQMTAPDLATAVPVPMGPGEILVIDRFLAHGSPENKSRSDRVALLSLYQKPKAAYPEAEAAVRMELLRS